MNKYLEKIKSLDELKKEQFEKYYEILLEESQKYNLTTITTKEEVYIKHFYDSILILEDIELDGKLIDVGSGAGFPGIPLKIMCPELEITLVEPTTKRANFLNLVINRLDLKKINVINDRAENIAQKHIEEYDYATCRAVAQLNIILELLTTFVKIDGHILALKGTSYKEEINNSQNAIKILKLKEERIINKKLPNNLGERNIIIYKKIGKTPLVYPRHFSKIKKKGL